MPGLLAEDSHPEGNLMPEKEMHANSGSQASPASPCISPPKSDGIAAPRSDTVEAENPDQDAGHSNGDPVAAQTADQVLHDPSSISPDANCMALEHSIAPQGPAVNSGSEVESQEQVAAPNGGHAEDKASSPPPPPPAAHQQSKTLKHGIETDATQAPSLPSKSNPKKKPALSSPRQQTKPKESEKEKPPSPRPAGNKPKEAGKEKLASPKVPSSIASALKAKDTDRGKIESVNLPLPAAAAATKEAEKEKTVSPEKNKAQDSPKVKDKAKPTSLSVPVRRPPGVTTKPPENPSPTENVKHTAALMDKERASPNSPASPSRPSSKTAFASPLKPLRVTPPPSSEKAPFSTSKISPGKRPSRLTGPESPASVNKGTEKDFPLEKALFEQERAPSESDKLNYKVKTLFQRRKSGVASRKFGDTDSVASSDHASVLIRENPNLGPFLLKLARQAIMSGDNPQKALDYASRAAKSYEIAADGKPSLDLVMSLHILAATHCTMGQFEDAIPVLQQSIAVTDIEGGGQDHALAAFAGNMQLGDTYSLLGRGDDALAAYHLGLEVQKRALGEMDPRVGETCRYLAEAHTQAMQFDKAEELCQHALNIHKDHSAPASVEEATDRRLMGLICNGKGEHEAALEHLVLASMALIANGKDVDVASVDTCIGDTYASLGRFEEAVFSYQKALTVFKASKGENHVAVASVYVSLAELYMKTGKFRECKTYCDSALRIYNKQGVGTLDEVASGLTELAVVYEALNEQEQALSLLKKALGILDTAPGQQSSIAGVEAQIGVLSYMCGNYVDARSSLSKAVSKLRGSAEKTSALFGIVLNQMGLCCLHLSEIKMATQLFEESRSVLESACGPHHPDTLTVYSNLAGAYDALGRLDEAIGALQYVVEVREEELGTANSDVEDERSRLAELLREAGRLRTRRLNNTLGLLMHPKSKPAALAMPRQSVTVPVNG